MTCCQRLTRGTLGEERDAFPSGLRRNLCLGVGAETSAKSLYADFPGARVVVGSVHSALLWLL